MGGTTGIWPANLGEDDALSGHLLPGLELSGVPRELRGTTVTFRANDRWVFDDLISRCGQRLAAVIMEPCRNEDPDFCNMCRQNA